MDDDEPVSPASNDRTEDFAGVGDGFGETSGTNFNGAIVPEPGVEQRDDKLFLPEPGQLRGESSVDGFGRIEWSLGELFAGCTGTELERGDELACFSEPKAGSF